MRNNKQSSVEWLIDNLYLKDSLKWQEVIEKAKAMHKEEIIKAVTFGQNNHTVMISRDLIIATEYYNETFGGNNENL